MVSLALLVLLLKLMGGQALKTYYSDMAQARYKGDNLTYESARACGYDEEGINMMSLPQRARDKMDHIHQLRLDVCKAYSKHLSSVAHVCSEGDLGKAALHERIRKSFEGEVADKVARLRSAEERLGLEGFKPPDWSYNLPYVEEIATHWLIDDEKLREMGWRDPDRKVAERAIDRMKKLYIELTEAYYSYEGQLRAKITRHSKEEVVDWAHKYYIEQIVPRLKETAECEMAITHGGLKVPNPPSGLPSEEELRRIGEIPPSILAKVGAGDKSPSTNGAKGSIHPV
jgi:hypothetical protein